MVNMEYRDGFFKHQKVSFGYAIEGIVYSFNSGLHFRMHVGALILVVILGLVYRISYTEWLVIIITTSGVIGAEAINTAIEETCNVLHPDLHPKARLAKHCAAGGVLILSFAAVVVGIIIFAPKIFSF